MTVSRKQEWQMAIEDAAKANPAALEELDNFLIEVDPLLLSKMLIKLWKYSFAEENPFSMDFSSEQEFSFASLLHFLLKMKSLTNTNELSVAQMQEAKRVLDLMAEAPETKA